TGRAHQVSFHSCTTSLLVLINGQSASHQHLLTWPTFRSHADDRPAARTKFQAQPTSTFIRSMLECFRGRAYELLVLGREEHLDAKSSPSSSLAEGAMAATFSSATQRNWLQPNRGTLVANW